MDTVKLDPNMDQPGKCPQCGTPLATDALGGLCPACLLKQGAVDDTVTEGKQPPFQPPTVEELAPLFPQLEILELIGKGGMGAVYKARQKQLDRFVALKILPPGIGGDPAFAERFAREAKALAKLNHPGIVTLYEFGEASGLFYFFMEFVDGVNLRQLLQNGRVSAREALAIVPQICDALQFAHDQGIVHRDIKPENILMDRRGRVKVADFGLAKIVGNEPLTRPSDTLSPSDGERDGVRSAPVLTDAGKVMGTPQYMSPEQIHAPGEVDHRADIYALGVVFYQMLTGELPGKRLEPPSKKVSIDVRLDEVVLRALEKNPERRYQQVSQVKTCVETIAGMGAAPPADPETLVRNVLAADYSLSIRSCLRRGWKLVRANFWPLVGMTALILTLYSVAASAFRIQMKDGTHFNTSIIALLLSGPLFAGLDLYFLKKIRGERTSVETAFAGFSRRFLQLFLAHFVVTMLVVLGLVCLILPGIYLYVAWIFALPLVLDKGLDFWAAMELSRKAVNKHWWKVFLLLIVMALVSFGGMLALCIGMFITVPIAIAAQMYAYEEIFSAAGAATNQAVPSGRPANKALGIGCGLLALGGVVALALVLAVGGFFYLRAEKVEAMRHRAEAQHRADYAAARAQTEAVVAAATTHAKSYMDRVNAEAKRQQEHIKLGGRIAFEPVMELVVHAPDGGRTECVDLDTGRIMTMPFTVITNPTALSFMQNMGGELAADGANLVGADLIVAERPETDWESLAAEQVLAPFTWTVGAASYPTILRPQDDNSATWVFMTQAGRSGLLQITGLTDNPRGVKLRYKLVQSPATTPPVPPPTQHSFGPVIEQVLNDGVDAGGQNMFLDLDTSRILSETTNVQTMGDNKLMLHWLATNGIDLVAVNQREAWTKQEADDFEKAFLTVSGQRLPRGLLKGFISYGATIVPLSAGEWTAISPDALATTLNSTPAATVQFNSAHDDGPDVFGFKTREGRAGLLQIAGFAENPRGVKIRYKLVQVDGPGATGDGGLFRDYPVRKSFAELARTTNPNTPETVQAVAAMGIMESDPATVLRRHTLDLMTFPAGGVNVTLTEKGKDDVRQSHVLRTVIYRDALAVVIFRQAGGLISVVHGRRDGPWKIFTGAELPDAATENEAVTNFKTKAPGFYEALQKLPAQPSSFAQEAGKELATNMSEIMGAMMGTLGQVIGTMNTQVVTRVPGMVAGVQQATEDLQRQLQANARQAATADLKARLGAAEKITSFTDRDTALAVVACEAAKAGEAGLARQALGTMTAFNARDKAALDAARALVKAGRRAEAVDIARTITSFSQRDAALKELAQ